MPSLILSPELKLTLLDDEESACQELSRAFEKGSGHGLLALDTTAVPDDDSFLFWKDFTRLYLSFISAIPDLASRDVSLETLDTQLTPEDLTSLLLAIPAMKGAEYVNEESLRFIWNEIKEALKIEILDYGQDLSAYFNSRHSEWTLQGRVCFHLAENKSSEETPFAFMATYVHQVSTQGKTQHYPLSRAIEEYSGPKQKNTLLRLLSPLYKASQESSFIKNIIDSGQVYHPLAWTPREAHNFLKDIPLIEKAGIAIKVPNWWKQKRPSRPQATLRLGEKKSGGMGFNALFDASFSIKIGEEDLSKKEIRELLERSDQLVFFKGQWIEVDPQKLQEILAQWKLVSKLSDKGIGFAEGLQLLAGVKGKVPSLGEEISAQTRVVAGKWIKETLDQLRSPDHDLEQKEILRLHLKATLRPYQAQGVHWLHHLNQLRLGGILADDMGLGKTIQVISLLLLKKYSSQKSSKFILVVPASLIGNWKNELDRFAPSLSYCIAHSSGHGVEKPIHWPDLVISTFSFLSRLPWALDIEWDLILADEAQAIKNPDSIQTQAIKSLNAHHRIALTGTPVENHLTDLWSLFDFVSPGLLGSAKEFESFMKRKKKGGENPYPPLRKLVQPYILRRLKTDKTVINDLPDKIEMKTYCQFSKAQVALYQKSLNSLTQDLEVSDGIKRKGLIFSYLMRFKQICNHPSQFLKTEIFHAQDSGKFLRLKEICEIIYEKQERVLVFTQFQEMTQPLHDFLENIFGHKGLILHGGTPVKKRTEMVKAFQKDTGPGFFILSLKAGGTGLNLTCASHVIHFDRWWNPAVENQATDRAFRIGQKRNVFVHKFICEGTLEEKIDLLLESKKNLSEEILGSENETNFTELNNTELLKIVGLDIHSTLD